VCQTTPEREREQHGRTHCFPGYKPRSRASTDIDADIFGVNAVLQQALTESHEPFFRVCHACDECRIATFAQSTIDTIRSANDAKSVAQ
jgi:hypothetical protein